MNLPQIDLASLPGIDGVTGIFGSVMGETGTYGDSIVAIMVYIYEVV